LECPLQSKEEVEVTGHQVRTVGGGPGAPNQKWQYGWSFAAVVWGLASSNTLIRLSQNCLHHRHIICINMTSGPYTSTRWLWMHAGHALLHCPVFNTALHQRACMMVICPTTNEEGCLCTQNTVTPHQSYAVPRNKMEKLIFQLSYIVYSFFQ
jgi:hypothetical protein